MPRAQLSEGDPLTTWKVSLGFVDGWGDGIEDRVCFERVHVGDDSVRVDESKGLFVSVRRHDAIGEEWIDDIAVFCLQCLLHPPRTRIRRHDVVRGMARTRGGGQELGSE